MLIKIQLKNSSDAVLVDDFVYEYLTTNEYLKKVEFVYNLRAHSSGRPVFQKAWRLNSGEYKTETIYLHKFLGEKFLDKPKDSSKKLIMIKNGDPLDCRTQNLEWNSRSAVKRNTRKTVNQTGYIGVSKDRNQYRAIIYVDRKPIPIGRYESAEEAAFAYNQKSIEIFGITRNLNKVNKKELPEKLHSQHEKMTSLMNLI